MAVDMYLNLFGLQIPVPDWLENVLAFIIAPLAKFLVSLGISFTL